MSIKLGPMTRVSWDTEELAFPARLFLGLDDGLPMRWNGWACPAFPRASVDAIAAWNAAHPDGVDQLTWDGDTLVIADPDYSDEPPDRMEPVIWEGEPYWPVGAWSWTWWALDCQHCGKPESIHLSADECEAHGIDPGLRDGLGCAVIARVS